MVSFFGLDLVDSVDTLLGCGFTTSYFYVFIFFLITLLALIVTSLFVVTSICGALRNFVEAMFGEDFGRSQLKIECFQVQPVTRSDLSILFSSLRHIPYIPLYRWA